MEDLEYYKSRADEFFMEHQDFLLKLCEILKLDYTEVEEVDILDAIKGLLISDELFQCDIPGCHAEAQYQGWYRKRDFAGLSTGLIQNLKVCGGHAPLLIGYKKEG